jgi:hypothetical protein
VRAVGGSPVHEFPEHRTIAAWLPEQWRRRGPSRWRSAPSHREGVRRLVWLDLLVRSRRGSEPMHRSPCKDRQHEPRRPVPDRARRSRLQRRTRRRSAFCRCRRQRRRRVECCPVRVPQSKEGDRCP